MIKGVVALKYLNIALELITCVFHCTSNYGNITLWNNKIFQCLQIIW